MSGLFVEFWLMRFLDEDQIKQINELVNQIGKDISTKRLLWHEYPWQGYPSKMGKRPLDLILDFTLSPLVLSKLTKLDKLEGRGENDVASVGWGFQFANSASIPGAPSAEKYKFEDYYPHFGINVEHEPFRLLTGWGTNQYGSRKSIEEYAEEFEDILSYLDDFPVATGMIISKFPYDCLLLGYLAIQLLEICDGYLVVSTRDISTGPELDKLLAQVQQGMYPGRIFRLARMIETNSGPREYVKHIVDVDFLREWIKHPSFSLF